jgi:nucleotide-binding universal stress UspA family protein
MPLERTTAGAALAPDVPTLPSREQRDEHGRRIAVTFESDRFGRIASTADRWLVALDGSWHSLQALNEAIELAVERGVPALDLVTVHHWLSKEAAETELAPRGWATTADARALLDARGFGWRLHVLMGEPAARIVELAESLRSRGIVVGARGLSAFDGLLLGSVAQQVIHTARAPVLVVRTPVSREEKAPC